MRPQKQIPIEEICRILEIPMSSWGLVGNLNAEQAKLKLEEFQALVKEQKKILSKKYHPDKTGNEDDTKIKEINNIIDKVMELKILIQRKPTPRFFRYTINPSGATDSAASGAAMGGFTFHFTNRN